MKRNDLIKTYHHLYEFHDLGHRLQCAYCNDVRETLDHVPPISLVHKMTPTIMRERGVKFILLPACKHCNQILSSRPLANYEERLLFVYNRTQDYLEDKTFWSDDDLKELTGNLKRMIEAKQLTLRREYMIRLRGMEYNLVRVEEIMALLA